MWKRRVKEIRGGRGKWGDRGHRVVRKTSLKLRTHVVSFVMTRSAAGELRTPAPPPGYLNLFTCNFPDSQVTFIV